MAVVYPYVVTLKNRKTRYIDILGFLLLLISLVLFLREMIVTKSIHFAYLAGSIFIAGVIIWNFYSGLIKKKRIYFKYGLLIAALVWMKMPYYQWLFFAFLVLALLEYNAKYAIEIGFSEKEILINSLFKKRFKWADLSNVMLKDGLLTMDFYNNKLLQEEVLDDEEDDADEEEFNRYCREQLTKSQAA